MKPKLKENPREWQKFTGVIAFAICLLAFLLLRRARISREAFAVLAVAAVFVVAVSLFFPRWFRGFYRAGMTISFHIGQVMGSVLLTILFLLVVTPLGLLLRLFRKDLLNLKWDRTAPSYFTPAKFSNKFDRMF